MLYVDYFTVDLVNQGPKAYDSFKVHGTSPTGMTEQMGSEPVLINFTWSEGGSIACLWVLHVAC